ncbi:MAG: protein phosphatase 2C domain-containing protein [Ruminococcus sp.]|nr:protein phosphatase 2C domain-containing protein [Ruminococcus sp.]
MWNIFRRKEEVPYKSIIDEDEENEITEDNDKNTEEIEVPHESKTIIYEREYKSDIMVCVSSDVGKVRENNEDNFYCEHIGYRQEKNFNFMKSLNRVSRGIFAVCDGMGGEAYGEEASKIAVETLEEMSREIKSALSEKLHDTVNNYADEANGRICEMVEEKRCKRSGSTLAMVCIVGEYAYAFNIGDSRVYFFSDGKIKQITEDQTLAMRKLKANIYTEEEARNSPDSHKITSFLGVDDRRIGLHSLQYPPFEFGDGKILICSDGLTDMCSDDEIAEILSSDSENYAEVLVKKALDNGGQDNVTCIVIQKNDEV